MPEIIRRTVTESLAVRSGSRLWKKIPIKSPRTIKGARQRAVLAASRVRIPVDP